MESRWLRDFLHCVRQFDGGSRKWKRHTSFEVGAVKPLFQTRLPTARMQNDMQYDVSRDGRFLIKVSEQTSSAPNRVVVNWTAALKK